MWAALAAGGLQGRLGAPRQLARRHLPLLEQDHVDDTLGAVSGLLALATVDGYSERWLDGQGAGAAAAGVAVEYTARTLPAW